MVPIEPILEDIKQKLGTNDVRLPGRGEIESLAISSEVSKTLTVARNDGQTPSSDGRQINKATGVLKNLKWENLLEILPDTDNHLSNQQRDEIINEKSSMPETIPETIMAQVAPRPEQQGHMNEVNRSTTDPLRSASLSAHDITPISISLKPNPNALQSSLRVPPDPKARCAIVNKLWQLSLNLENLEQDYHGFNSFFEYYNREISVALREGGSQMMIRTHQDLINIVYELRDVQATRSALKERLRGRLPVAETEVSDELICNVLDLGARIWLMTSIGTFRGTFAPSRRTLQWQDNESLTSLLGQQFSHQMKCTGHVKLERLFNARTIEHIAGIKITWTNNLADHLRLLDDDTRVTIFHHASFLKTVESWYVQHSHNTPYSTYIINQPHLPKQFFSLRTL
jgi:hypothetical protein